MTTNSTQKIKILLLGDYRHCLTVIRSLSRAGYKVIAGQVDPSSPFGQYSRYTSEVWNHPPAEGSGESFIRAIEEFLSARNDISFIFPIGDDETSALARNISKIPASVKVIMPAPHIVKTCHMKKEMCKIIEELNIPQGKFKEVCNLSDLKEAADEIGYPCIIRPVDQFTHIFDEKVFICRTSKIIEEKFKDWPCGAGSMIVQEYIPYHRHDFYCLAEKGEIIAGFELKALRTDRFNGSGITVDGISLAPSDEVLDACRKLLKHFNYTGLSCTQFLVDDDGHIRCFLEINPRVGASLALPDYCGVDLPKMALELAKGRSFLPADNNFDYRIGTRLGWLYGDIQGLRREIASKKIGGYGVLKWMVRLVKTFAQAKVHPGWSLADPMPTIRLYLSMGSFLFCKFSHSLVRWVE